MPVMNNTAGLLITMDKLAQYESFFINIVFARNFLIALGESVY